MLFNSYVFIFLFFPIAVLGYYELHHIGWEKAALGFLVAMSLIFYGYNSSIYLAILVVSILLNYFLVCAMNRIAIREIRRLFLAAGLLLDIGILFYFKYYDFFIENLNGVLGTNYHFLRMALPLGISFYTFQQLSYVIDSYKGECEQYSLLEYAIYVSFFPQLIAGPIVYHDELIPQFRRQENHNIHYENLCKGIYAFALGMAKKVLVADTMSKVVTAGFSDVEALNSISTVVVMICYSIQIYFDFSGYCDMAYGIGFMFNIELPINFNSPYKAASIKELWNRWHMTLTRFFIKYVYIPLGGSRKGKIAAYLNTMIVFLVSGIWHGANWTFILWGVLNGTGILLERIFANLLNKVPRIIRKMATYCFFTLTLVLFRSESLKQSWQMFHNFFEIGDGQIHTEITESFNKIIEVSVIGHLGLKKLIETYPWLLLVIFIVVVLLACQVMRNTQEKVKDGQYGTRKIVTTVVLLTWSILSLSEISEFLYYNF